jgi:hypothetical protein
MIHNTVFAYENTKLSIGERGFSPKQWLHLEGFVRPQLWFRSNGQTRWLAGQGHEQRYYFNSSPGMGMFNMVYMFNFCNPVDLRCEDKPVLAYEALEVNASI